MVCGYGTLLCTAVALGSTLASPAPPAQMPESLMWRITLVEHHDRVKPGAEDFTFGNYYFDWSEPLVASRQENAVGYAAWRLNATQEDIPWNTFWAWKGSVAAAYVDLTKQTVQCRQLPLPYNESFWPRDFLESQCQPSGAGPEAMPARFGGRFFDGDLAVPRKCQLGGGSMSINPVAWTDPSTGALLRLDFQVSSPGWERQTWDILQQVDVGQQGGFVDGFMQLPEWCAS